MDESNGISIRDIYDKMENDLELSLWAGEQDLPPKRVSRECTIVSNSDPNIQSYILAHYMFGDPKSILAFSMFCLQASGNVVDNTHPFDVLQTMIHLLVFGNITLEVKGEISHFRDTCILYPWGTTHLRKLLHFPIRRLDTRGKQACASLLSARIFAHTNKDTSTNSVSANVFSFNEYVQKVYDHWKPLHIALFLWRVMDDVKYISKIRDLSGDISKMIELMCRHGLSQPPSPLKSNGFFHYRIPGEDGLIAKEFDLLERIAPDIPHVSANYNVILPWSSSHDHHKKSKSSQTFEKITIRRLYGNNARLLSDCWHMVLNHSFQEIVEYLFTLLAGKIYPRAFTFRIGPPPPELSHQAKRLQIERLLKEEKKKEFTGEYSAETFYHY